MPRTSETSFGALSNSLLSLGFESKLIGGNIVFAHPRGRPVILLPAYENDQNVSPIHMTMVRKHLVDGGVIDAAAFRGLIQGWPASSRARGLRRAGVAKPA